MVRTSSWTVVGALGDRGLDMRALIIGSGSIGQRHAASLRSLRPDVEFTLLRHRPRHDDVSKRLNADVFGDFESALITPCDLAVVATPSFAHADVLPRLLAADIPCYVEKPLITREEDVHIIRNALVANCTPITQMGCNLRFLPSLRQLRNALRADRIGRVIRATLEVGQWLPDWRPGQDYRQSYSASTTLGGGAIFDLIHELDMARWLFGEFDQVNAMANQLSSLDIQSEDVAWITLSGHDTPLVGIGLDYISRKPMRRYRLVGELGTITWDLGEQRMWLDTSDATETLNDNPADFDMQQTYVTAMHEFIAAIEQHRSTSQDIHEGLASAELAIAARHAAGLPC